VDAVDPNQPFDIRGMGIAFAILAVPAAIAILLFGFASQWRRPRWAFPAPPWNGFVIVFAFFGYYVAVSLAAQIVGLQGWFADAGVENALTWNGTAGRVIATPLYFAFVGYGIFNAFGSIRVPPWRKLTGWIALGALAWFPIHVIATAVHFATTAVSQEIGGPISQHPMAKLDIGQYRFGAVLFASGVCVMAPWFEEFFFRGVVLTWVLRAWYRPWILVGWSFAFSCLAIRSVSEPQFGAYGGALGFSALGAVIMGCCQRLPTTYPKRTILAVVSTSLLFAAVHSSVWPSPVPLFVLGLGLGYLTARSGSIVPAIVVHALFNAVSFVYLLRLPA